MSDPRERDPAIGFAFVERLLAEEQVEPAPVPSAAALLGKATARAGDGKARDPAVGFGFVERLLAEGQAEPRRVPSARELLRGVAAKAAPLPARPRGWRARLGWLAAAALVMIVAALAALNAEALVALLRGHHEEPIGPDQPFAPPTPPTPPRPPPVVEALRLRKEALSDCGQGFWPACEDKLDQALGMDPAGDGASEVQAARQQMAQALAADGGERGDKGPRR